MAPALHTLHTVRQAADWLAARVRTGGVATLRTDSRAVQPGDAFIAWPGYATDGRRYVQAALAAGAAACLVEAEGAEAYAFDDARIATLPGLKAATGPLAAAWFGQPAQALDVVAVTGTNGKSSTAWWTAQALSALGRRCGVVGTLGVGEPPLDGAPGSITFTGLTTPDPVTLHAGFRRMADAGFTACAVEASSIGLVEQRLAGTPVTVAQFTNFSRDHLDFHADMAAYWAAKRPLFSWPGLRAAVVNIDDAQGAALAAELQAGGLDLWTVSVCQPARLRALDLGYTGGGLSFTLAEGTARVPVCSRLIGDYNASNLLGVLAALRALGVPLADAAAVVPRLTPVPGRMDRVPTAAGQPEVVVDYAHTPDALDKALGALRPLAAARGGALWCVFGCGGNRDASKRPLMGAIAERLADRVVLTSDNPRLEDPLAILAQVRAGLQRAPAAQIEDRAAAIAHAVQHAAADDVVLIAGKGHEDYQDAAGVKRPFLDADVAARALAAKRGKRAERRADPRPDRDPHGGTTGVHAGRGAPMTLMTLAEAHALLPGSTLLGDPDTPILRVHSDTRTLQPGDLFVALRGDSFDAHAFLPTARAAGAAAALAEHGIAEAGLPGLQVADALAALQQLAAGWRLRHAGPVIAVAGSNGKTTVTQMVAAILRAHAGALSLATAGNYNSRIGLPLQVLRLQPAGECAHTIAVFELGMNHPGEIAELAAIARPTVALVNNAQREHQEFMASVEAVAQENGCAITVLPADGVAVYPADDAHAGVWRGLAGSRRQVTFAMQGPADLIPDPAAPAVWHADAEGGHWQFAIRTPAGAATLQLHIPGRHNLHNALAAASSALAAGVPLAAVVQGLAAFRPVAGRSRLLPLQWAGRAVTLVDDSYNANPDSVRAAIDVLASLPAPRWLVLGDMGEVGDQGPAFHAEVGAYAHAAGIEQFWAAGSACADAARAFGPGARHFADAPAVIAALGQAPACGAVLVKGSKFMHMPSVVVALQTTATQAAAGDCACC